MRRFLLGGIIFGVVHRAEGPVVGFGGVCGLLVAASAATTTTTSEDFGRGEALLVGFLFRCVTRLLVGLPLL
jgi:hypothetical protein